jgi:glycosyl-4,4'-diaponeurosporenoate acyltransferase
MPRTGRHAWLHALLLLAFVLVFGVSFAMISTLVGITSPWLALLLMLYFLGLGKVAEPVFMLKMPKGLYELRPWEQEAKVARRLRIPSFGRLLRRTPLRYLNSDVYLDQRRRDPLEVRLRAESAEALHFWAGVLFMPFIAFAAIAARWSAVGWFLLAQLLVNIYPILHLRHIRWRLNRAMRRMGGAGRQSAA